MCGYYMVIHTMYVKIKRTILIETYDFYKWCVNVNASYTHIHVTEMWTTTTSVPNKINKRVS